MIGMLFAGCIISLLIAAVTAYLLLKFVRQEIGRIQEQQQHQLQGQETQLQLWRSAQEKRLSDLEQQHILQLQQLRTTQKAREEAESQRFKTLIKQYEEITTRARVEYELAQLPRLEDVPLPGPDHQQQQGFVAQRTPPNLQGYDLSKRDLSSRYLSHADLRQTNLSSAKLFMADLSWANLADANLSEAELSAANLTYANLRGAKLQGASFLVADLNHAILIGADLRGAHSLSLEQIATTIYDSTTQFDPELASKLPKKPRTSRPLETGRPSEAVENTNRIPALPKKQEPPAPDEHELPAPSAAEQALQTPTGDILPLATMAPPAYQTPLEIPAAMDDILSLPAEGIAVAFPKNSEAH